MKNHKFIRTCLLIAGLMLSSIIYAQKPRTICNDPIVKGKAASIVETYKKQGLVVLKENALAMTSMEPIPIAVQLQQGMQYEFVFVGSQEANRLIMELFDGNDRKIEEKIAKGVDYMTYTFTAPRTEVYLITLIQKKGTKDLCGHFSILMQGNYKTPGEATPAPIGNPDITTKEAPSKPAYREPVPPPVYQKPQQPTPVQMAKDDPVVQPASPKTEPAKPSAPRDPMYNQRPNPNRTRATKEYQRQQKQLGQ